MDRYPNKRINLQMAAADCKESEFNILATIRKARPDLNFSVALAQYNEDIIARLKSKNLPFYIATPCQDWEEFYHLVMDCGVSDICIGGQLGFELPAIRKFIDNKLLSTQIRVTPNIVTTKNSHTQKIIGFFIRPEDIDIYYEYIDVIEFEDVEKQNYFYSIYILNKMFYGKLSQIIFGAEQTVDNKAIIPMFAERRLNCHRECLKGGRCNRCFTIANIAKNMSAEIEEKMKDNILKQLKEQYNDTN
jgi:hypothetical protein